MNSLLDYANPPQIGGWVHAKEGAAQVVVRREGVVVCSVSPGFQRSDFADGSKQGFIITIEGSYRLSDLTSGKLTVSILIEGNEQLVELWRPIQMASNFDSLHQGEKKVFSRTLKRYDSAAFLTGEEGISACQFPVGLASKDYSAMVGKAGYLYLYRGANDAQGAYSRPADPAVVNAWLNLLAARTKYIGAAGAKHIQVFIPEKSSTVPELAPFEVAGPTPLWSAIVPAAREVGENVVDVEQVFRGVLAKESCFRRHDSHLSTRGSLHVVREIVRRMGWHPENIGWTSLNRRRLRGDLSGKFQGFSEAEPEDADVVSEVLWDGLSTGHPKLLDEFSPESGHQGTMRHWKCESAPIDARVICFGNSFFERGGASCTLSWWCARLFSEFKFVWSANVIDDEVASFGGQFVICQTIERFLNRVPTT